MPPTKTQRFLDLIAFLAGRRVPVVVEEIMEKVPPYAADWVEGDETARASVRRKFERDKDELREMGIPIETVEYSINYGLEQARGYRLRDRDFYLPWLRVVSGGEGSGDPTGDRTTSAGEGGAATGERVDPARSASRAPYPSSPRFELREDEARAAVDALRRVAELPSFPFRRQARSALRKLTFDLDGGAPGTGPPGDGPGGGGAGGPTLRFLPPPGSEDLRERLSALSDALLRRKEVEFRYHGIHRDRWTERRVRPYGLLFQHSHWYLVAHDPGRDAMRVFRVGRMGEPRVNPRRAKTPDYEVPDDFDLADWSGRPPWALPGQEDEPEEVVVRFDFPRSLWAERNGHGERVEALDDGAQLRRFRVQDREPFLRWLLALEGEATVEAPAEVGDRLRAMARRVAEVHAPKDG